jgi:hypothetical protein
MTEDKPFTLAGGKHPMKENAMGKPGYSGSMLELSGPNRTATKAPTDTTNHYDTASTAVLYGRTPPKE